MIPLIDEPPRQTVLDQLDTWQAAVDAVDDYAERVAQARRWFESRNQEKNPTFGAIRAALRNMASGAERCHYCEDSLGSQVEHVRPKSLYPDHAFRWLNYVLSCQPCNTAKLAKYAVIRAGQLVDVSRAKNAPITPPLAGDMAMLDPRTTEPEWLALDLEDTFWIQARSGVVGLDAERVEYTINTVLRLNADPHPERRRDAYSDYRAALSEYAIWSARGVSQSRLDGLRARIARRDHIMVWREILRQYQLNRRPRQLQSDFGELFEAVPEALRW